jgi:hypothetical protein
MPRDECKDIEDFDEVGAALGEIVDPRLLKIASNQDLIARVPTGRKALTVLIGRQHGGSKTPQSQPLARQTTCSFFAYPFSRHTRLSSGPG